MLRSSFKALHRVRFPSVANLRHPTTSSKRFTAFWLRQTRILAATMRPLDILSVTGRALFFRFLHDRRIVLQRELSEICPSANDLKDVFSDAERAAATSCWLDETFNGDFLPLVDVPHSTLSNGARKASYTAFFREAGANTGGRVFLHLEAVMRGWKHVDSSGFQTTDRLGRF